MLSVNRPVEETNIWAVIFSASRYSGLMTDSRIELLEELETKCVNKSLNTARNNPTN